MKMTAGQRWSWKAWQERLDSSPLSGEQKELVGRVRSICGRKRRWLAFWEIDTASSSRDPKIRDALFAAQEQRLIRRCFGGDDWLPVLGPPLPAPRSIRITLGERRVLERLLTRNGWGLAHVVKPGYCTQRSDNKTRWMWRRNWTDSEKVSHRCCDSLKEKGLIEPDGTLAGGWRDPSVYFYRATRHLIYAVAGKPLNITP